MTEPNVRLRAHGRRKDAFCIFCGTFYEQECVAAEVFVGQDLLGDVCPVCLADGPAHAAEQARARAARLRARAEQVARREGDGSPGAAAAGQRADRLRARSDELVALAGDVGHAAGWDVSVGDVQQAERAALRQQYPTVAGEVLHALVDARYRRARAGSHGPALARP